MDQVAYLRKQIRQGVVDVDGEEVGPGDPRVWPDASQGQAQREVREEGH